MFRLAMAGAPGAGDDAVAARVFTRGLRERLRAGAGTIAARHRPNPTGRLQGEDRVR